MSGGFRILGPLGLFLAGGAVGYFLYQPRPPEAAAPSGPERQGLGIPVAETVPAVRSAVFQEAEDFLSRLDAAGVEDLPGLWAESPPRPEGDENPMPPARRLAVAQRWAELDPAGALEFLRDKSSGPWLLMAVFEIWGVKDREGALAWLKAEKDDNVRAAAAVGWLRGVKDDPAELLSRAERLNWMPEAGKLEKDNFEVRVSDSDLFRLYQSDPQAMKRLAGWLPEWFGKKLEALEWRQALEADPEEAMKSLEAMELNRDQLTEMLGWLAPLAESRPERVADLLEALAAKERGSLMEETSWNDRNRVFLRTLIEKLGVRDPERMRQLLPKLKGTFAAGDILSDRFFETHPGQALRIAPALNKFEGMREMMGLPTPAMDPDSALAAVRDAPASWLRDSLLESGLLTLRTEDPKRAEAWVEGLPAGELREAARLTLDLAEAPASLRNLERVGRGLTGDVLNEEDQAWLRAVLNRGSFNGMEAMSENVMNWPGGAAQNYALQDVARGWVDKDTEGGLAWAGSLPEGELQVAAYTGIAEGWTRSDPVAASEWVAGLPPGAVREAAVGEFSVRLAELDPGAGLQWAATLQDPADRQARLTEVAQGWKDRNAALAAIASLTNLSGEEKAALTNSLKP